MESARRRANHRATRAASSGSGNSGLWAFLFLSLMAMAGVVMIARATFTSSGGGTGSAAAGGVQRQVLDARPVLAAVPVEPRTAGSNGTAAVTDSSARDDAARTPEFESAATAFTLGRIVDAAPQFAGMFDSSLTGTSAAMALQGVFFGSSGNSTSTGSAALTGTPVPEPSTWALLALSGAAVAARWLLKRRRLS